MCGVLLFHILFRKDAILFNFILPDKLLSRYTIYGCIYIYARVQETFAAQVLNIA